MVCPNCGERNPERARFCFNCGQPLSRAPVEGEERKLVTVIFVDLVGFTARSDHADPEDVKATLRPYHARLKQEIEHFGGTLDKFLGDGVLGVFGAPTAHEDDPERAVRAALRIQEAMGEVNRTTAGPSLAARAGVATGEAVVTMGRGPQIGESLTGDVVNTASRIQSVAPPGGVVVSATTFQATRDDFEYQDLGDVTLKGKAEPDRLWQATGIRSRMGVGVEVHERHGTPFVGRAEELYLLKAAYRRAIRESSVQLITMAGEPGVGKSRLLAEFRSTYIDELPELVRWRQGRCLPYGDGITFWALGEIVKAQAGILESDSPDEARSKLRLAVEAHAEDDAERDWLAARLAPLAGLTQQGAAGVERGESFTAWRRFLEGLAEEHPLILSFEDLQWADQPMLDFIEDVAEWSVGVPILILCAARPELYDRHPGWGGGRRNASTVPLMPLSGPETAMLLSSLVDKSTIPDDTWQALMDRAGGNPLYAEEFAQMLLDRRLDVETASDAPIPVPDTVQALVAARLDTLPAERKALLHDASVIGTVFWDGALAEMSGLPADRVQEDLHEMAKKELVKPSRTTTLAGQTEYAFWHSLVRDVAYGQIPRVARGRKHRAAAEWTERMAGGRVADRAEVLAYHYAQALELATATGDPDAAALQDRAAMFLRMAGDQAIRLDVGKAKGYLQRALELLPDGQPARGQVLIKLARAESIGADFDQAERHAQQAIDGYRGTDDTTGLGESLLAMGIALTRAGDTARARSFLEQARTTLEQAGPGPGLCRVYNRVAGQAYLSGRFQEAIEWAEKALTLAAQLRLADEEVRARQGRGAARCNLGDEAGLDDLREALRQGLELGLGDETALSYGNLAYQLWLRDGPVAARPVWQAMLEFADMRGFTSQAMLARAGLMEVATDLGEWDEVLRLTDTVVEWHRRIGGSEVGLYGLIYRALIHGWRGEEAEAAEAVEELLPAARKVEHPEVLAPALAAAMQAASLRRDLPAAVDLAHEFDRATVDHPTFRAGWGALAVWVLVAANDLEAARHLLVDDGAVPTARHRYALKWARALVEEATGGVEGARRLFAEGVAEWRAYGFVMGQALALVSEARCLLKLAREGEAADRAGQARLLFTSLRAAPLIAEAERVLQPRGAGATDRPSPEPVPDAR